MGAATAFLTLDKKGRATLPEDVRRELAVGEGDIVLLERTERGTFELVPAALVPRAQLWFYHPEMQKRIRQAEESFGKGRAVVTRTPEDAQVYLDSLKKKRSRGR